MIVAPPRRSFFSSPHPPKSQDLGETTIISSWSPLGNTGTNCENNHSQSFPSAVTSQNEPSRFSSRVHWLQGTFNFSEPYVIQLLIERFKNYWPDDFFAPSHPMYRGRTKFNRVFISTRKIILAYNEPSNSMPGYAWLSIPGKSFDCWGDSDDPLSFEVMFLLLLETLLKSDFIQNFKTTSFHIALDDYHRKLTPAKIHFHAKKGNFTGYRLTSYRFQTSPWMDKDGNKIHGDTIDFGTSTSDKRITIYDKFVESRGEHDCIRFEAKFFDEQAHTRLLAIYNNFSSEGGVDFHLYLAQNVVGVIDFIDRQSMGKDCHLSSATRLRFWQNFVDDIGSLSFSIIRQKPFIEKTIEWISRQVETSLAIIDSIIGFEDFSKLFQEFIKSGKTRLKKTHKNLIDSARYQNLDVIAYYQFLKSVQFT